MGRVIGDGGTAFYIHDIIVLPEHQNKGLGKTIMENIMSYIKSGFKQGMMVYLMAAKGKEGFYEKFGFAQRPSDKQFYVRKYSIKISISFPSLNTIEVLSSPL